MNFYTAPEDSSGTLKVNMAKQKKTFHQDTGASVVK